MPLGPAVSAPRSSYPFVWLQIGLGPRSSCRHRCSFSRIPKPRRGRCCRRRVVLATIFFALPYKCRHHRFAPLRVGCILDPAFVLLDLDVGEWGIPGGVVEFVVVGKVA